MSTPAPDPRRWKALTVCLVAGFMALLDVSVVNVALDSIRTGLGASPSQLQWIVSGYALSYGLVLVPAGRLGDARGRRRVFVAGVALFTVSSLVAALAPSATWLVLARLAQGVGGGLLSPQMSAFILELFTGAERGTAFGRLGTAIGVSTAVGPVVGGFIIGAVGSADGWRWIFVLNLPIGLATILLSYRYLPPGRPVLGRESRHLDPVGVLLLGLALLAVLLPLVERDLAGTVPWVWPVAAVVLGTLLVLWERGYVARGRVPVVDMRLFGNRYFRNGALIGTVYFSGFTAVLFVVALHLQAGEGRSPLVTGLALTPFALASAVGATLGGRFITRVGRPVVVTGLVLSLVGLAATDVLLGVLPPDQVAWGMALPLGLAGLGAGLTISPNITLTLSEVAVPRAGAAGGMLQTGQRIGTAAGVALVGAVLFHTLGGTDDWRAATSAGLRTAIALVGLALVVAILDQRVGRRGRRLADRAAAAD